jgi:hypothetical protein
MATQCNRCRSYAINHSQHGRDGSDADLCDVCYWRKRAELMRAVLEAVEWIGLPAYCPWCQTAKKYGHRPDCQRQQTLGV